jgi:hypothetical protein
MSAIAKEFLELNVPVARAVARTRTRRGGARRIVTTMLPARCAQLPERGGPTPVPGCRRSAIRDCSRLKRGRDVTGTCLLARSPLEPARALEHLTGRVALVRVCAAPHPRAGRLGAEGGPCAACGPSAR